MLLNIPDKITKKDIKSYGIIKKGNSYSYILSDLKNRDKKNTFKLNGYGFYNYVYNILDTYLFIIGNQIKNKDVNPQNIDFVSKILKFEYLLSNNKLQKFDIPSQVMTIIATEKWLKDDCTGSSSKVIDNIIKNRKSYLNAYERPYERQMKYICDNAENSLGTFEYGLCKDLLIQDFIYIQKDTTFDGYIIKTDNRKYL
jgi:hypothetical protein